MTTESKKPSEILRPLYVTTWPYPTKEFAAYSDARHAIDDSHHSRLTALEAAMATLTPPKPAAEDEVVFKGIGDIVYAVVGDKHCVCFSDGTFSEWWTTEGAAFSRTIPRAEAEALCPAIRERFPVKAAVPSPQPAAPWPSDVVKVWEEVGEPDPMRWMLRDDGAIRCSYPPYTGWCKAGSTESMLDGGKNDFGDPVTRIYCRASAVGKSAGSGQPSFHPSRSVEDEAREFYCQRHEGVRLRDVAGWMVSDMIDFANQRTAAVEKERDKYKAMHEEVCISSGDQRKVLEDELSTVRSERDAALAKVERVRGALG